MAPADQEISTQVVVILLIPVVMVFGLIGYVVIDSLAVGQPPPSGPDASVVFEIHSDRLNRTAAGEGIVTGTLEGQETLNWSSLVIEVVDPREDAVIVSLSAPDWNTRGAGQTIAVHTNGTVPREGSTLTAGETFVLRDVDDDQDSSEDLVNPCDSYVFRALHDPTGTVLGTFRVTFVASDWAPGQSCDDVND